MNTDKLKKELVRLGVKNNYYAIEHERKDDAYNIELLFDGTFSVYYMERGDKCNIKIYTSREEANKELLRRINFNLDHGVDLT